MLVGINPHSQQIESHNTEIKHEGPDNIQLEIGSISNSQLDIVDLEIG